MSDPVRAVVVIAISLCVICIPLCLLIQLDRRSFRRRREARRRRAAEVSGRHNIGSHSSGSSMPTHVVRKVDQPMCGIEYRTVRADGGVWLEDQDGVRIAYGTSEAEALDQLDDSETWPNDDREAS